MKTNEEKLLGIVSRVLLPLIATNMLAAVWCIITETMAQNGDYIMAMVAGIVFVIDLVAFGVWGFYTMGDKK